MDKRFISRGERVRVVNRVEYQTSSREDGEVDVFDGTIDPVYRAKAQILNRSIQEIGMGKYQWGLFFVAGFGWFADNLWTIVTSLIVDATFHEFRNRELGPFFNLGQNIGLLVGAFFWGLGCDVWGRRWSFNITLFIVTTFALAAGAAPNSIALTTFACFWSVGVGGNLLVGSTIFLEFVPGTHQYLLTVLSIWWAFGRLIGSLIAWPFISNFSCPQTSIDITACPRSQNMGWRYFLFTMGGLMFVIWILRFFVFPLYESPKFLMGQGKEREAVEVVHKLAAYNGTISTLSVEELLAVDRKFGPAEPVGVAAEERGGMGVSAAKAVLKRKTEKFSGDHVRALFATRKLAWSTSLIIALWALIGLAFSLFDNFAYFYIGDGSTNIIYRNQVILSVIGVPGALLAGWAVELPHFGRKGTLAVSTILTGVFVFARTTAQTDDEFLGWNCGYSFTSNIMYAVLYTLSAELFATKDRGTGLGLAATANWMFSVMAPVISLYTDYFTSVPIYISGAIFIVAGFIALLLPFESRGKTAL